MLELQPWHFLEKILDANHHIPFGWQRVEGALVGWSLRYFLLHPSCSTHCINETFAISCYDTFPWVVKVRGYYSIPRAGVEILLTRPTYRTLNVMLRHIVHCCQKRQGWCNWNQIHCQFDMMLFLLSFVSLACQDRKLIQANWLCDSTFYGILMTHEFDFSRNLCCEIFYCIL